MRCCFGNSAMMLLISCLTLRVAEFTLASAFVGMPSGTFVGSHHRPGASPRSGALKSLGSSSASSHDGHDVNDSDACRHTRTAVVEPMLREGNAGGGISRAGFVRGLVSSAALACAAGTVVAGARGGPGIRAAIADDGNRRLCRILHIKAFYTWDCLVWVLCKDTAWYWMDCDPLRSPSRSYSSIVH